MRQCESGYIVAVEACVQKPNQSGIKFEVPWDKWHARIKKQINLECGIDRETPNHNPMRGKVNI